MFIKYLFVWGTILSAILPWSHMPYSFLDHSIKSRCNIENTEVKEEKNRLMNFSSILPWGLLFKVSSKLYLWLLIHFLFTMRWLLTCLYRTKLSFLILTAIFIFSEMHKILSLWKDTNIKEKHKSNAVVQMVCLCRFNI